MWPSLESWKHRFIYFLCYFFIVTDENQSSSRSTKRFMCSCGNNIKTVFKWIFECPASNKSCNMCHIGHGDSADLSSYLYKTSIVELSRICRKSSKNNLWLCLVGDTTKLIIVYLSSIRVFHLVAYKIEYLGNIGDRMSMCQVPPMRKVHAQYSIAWLTERKIRCNIGRCTRVRLYVGIFAIKKATRAIDTKLF